MRKLHFACRLILPWLLGPALGVAAHVGYQRAKARPRVRRAPVVMPEGTAGRLRLFLIGGQSNAAGRGELRGREPTIPSAFLFANDYRWRALREPSDDPAGQVDLASADDLAGYSLASSFAEELLRRSPSHPLGLIPCARGGASQRAWRRSLTDATLYGSMLKRAGAAAPMGRLRGLLWYQGEREAEEVGRAVGWRARFERWCRELRGDLHSPDLPIYFAVLAGTGDAQHPGWAVVQREQRGVQMPGVHLIDTTGLPVAPDHLHLTRAGQDELGRRFAAEAVKWGR